MMFAALSDSFNTPSALLLLPLLLPLVAWRILGNRDEQSVTFSSTAFADQIEPTLRQRLTWLPPTLLLLGLALLIVCLAGPREGEKKTIVDTEGVAMQLVVDRSPSMQAMDFKIGGEEVDRLTAIKDVAGRFVLGDDDLGGRVSDLIGLITFAGITDAVTPPTLDHAFLVSRLNETKFVERRDETGTAIGDAIGLAIEKLAAIGKNRKKPIKSKIVILLTDGENNAGTLEPLQAADLAKTLGIKIYTIGMGTKGLAKMPSFTDRWGRLHYEMTRVNIDEETLSAIADSTGGKYFRATDTKSLEGVYAEIDQLEKSEVEERHYSDYRELAVQPVRLGSLSLPPIGIWAMIVLGLQLVLKHTLFREFQ